jgi:hypothetical protein
MKCENCGWFIPGIALCRTDGVLTEDYEMCDSWKPITIADDIRQMSDEDLAVLLSNSICSECPIRYKCDGREEIDTAKCYKYWLKYLKSAKNSDN